MWITSITTRSNMVTCSTCATGRTRRSTVIAGTESTPLIGADRQRWTTRISSASDHCCRVRLRAKLSAAQNTIGAQAHPTFFVCDHAPRQRDWIWCEKTRRAMPAGVIVITARGRVCPPCRTTGRWPDRSRCISPGVGDRHSCSPLPSFGPRHLPT